MQLTDAERKSLDTHSPETDNLSKDRKDVDGQ